jgi:hypothetical protein
MEPTVVRLLLVIAAERLALGAIEQLPLARRVARVPNDDARLQAIAERVIDETTWKTIELEILSPDFPLLRNADRGVFLHEVLKVVSRVARTGR